MEFFCFQVQLLPLRRKNNKKTWKARRHKDKIFRAKKSHLSKKFSRVSLNKFSSLEMIAIRKSHNVINVNVFISINKIKMSLRKKANFEPFSSHKEFYLAFGTTNDTGGNNCNRASSTNDKNFIQNRHEFIIFIGIIARNNFEQFKSHWTICYANARWIFYSWLQGLERTKPFNSNKIRMNPKKAFEPLCTRKKLI